MRSEGEGGDTKEYFYTFDVNLNKISSTWTSQLNKGEKLFSHNESVPFSIIVIPLLWCKNFHNVFVSGFIMQFVWVEEFKQLSIMFMYENLFAFQVSD